MLLVATIAHVGGIVFGVALQVWINAQRAFCKQCPMTCRTMQ